MNTKVSAIPARCVTSDIPFHTFDLELQRPVVYHYSGGEKLQPRQQQTRYARYICVVRQGNGKFNTYSKHSRFEGKKYGNCSNFGWQDMERPPLPRSRYPRGLEGFSQSDHQPPEEPRGICSSACVSRGLQRRSRRMCAVDLT